MNLHKQNFVCWPSVGPQDIKQTYIHTSQAFLRPYGPGKPPKGQGKGTAQPRRQLQKAAAVRTEPKKASKRWEEHETIALLQLWGECAPAFRKAVKNGPKLTQIWAGIYARLCQQLPAITQRRDIASCKDQVTNAKTWFKNKCDAMGPSGGGRPHAADAPLFAVCEDVFGNDPAVRPTDTVDDGDNRSRGKNMPEASSRQNHCAKAQAFLQQAQQLQPRLVRVHTHLKALRCFVFDGPSLQKLHNNAFCT